MEGNKKDPLSIKIAEMLKDKNYNVVSLLGIPNDGRYNYLKENLKKEDDKIEQSDFNKVDRLTQKIINTRLRKNDVLRNPNYWINPAKIAHKLAMKNIKYTNKLKSLLPEGERVQPHLRDYLHIKNNEVTYNFSSQELISACSKLGVDFSLMDKFKNINASNKIKKLTKYKENGKIKNAVLNSDEISSIDSRIDELKSEINNRVKSNAFNKLGVKLNNNSIEKKEEVSLDDFIDPT